MITKTRKYPTFKNSI